MCGNGAKTIGQIVQINYQWTERLLITLNIQFRMRFVAVPGTTFLGTVPSPIATTSIVVTTISASVLCCRELRSFRVLREDSVFPLLSFSFSFSF